jgi:ketosteroid isomerase-like protein
MSDTDIVAVVEQLIEAENDHDADAAARLLAPDFAGITRARGVEQDRAGLLRAIGDTTGPSMHRRLEPDAWVRRSGDLAVVRSVVEVLDDSSPPGATRFRNVHVLIRHGEGWTCAAWQVTMLT